VSKVFTVEVAGTTPYTYQWYQDTGGNGVFSAMSGEESASLIVADTSTNQYYVVATNDCGMAQSNIVSVA